MVLRLSHEESQELRRALLEARAELLRILSEAVGCGYSARHLALCARRAHLDRMLDRLDHKPEPVPVSQPISQQRLVDAAA